MKLTPCHTTGGIEQPQRTQIRRAVQPRLGPRATRRQGRGACALECCPGLCGLPSRVPMEGARATRQADRPPWAGALRPDLPTGLTVAGAAVDLVEFSGVDVHAVITTGGCCVVNTSSAPTRFHRPDHPPHLARIERAMSGECLTLTERVRLGWWKAEAWLHRCSECGHRPDGHKDWMSRWEDDQTARMLGIGQYGCRRCGHGAIEERDAACDHSRCCRYHGTHSDPHKGCILR